MIHLRRLLYVSRLQNDDITVVPTILKTARANNSIHGETGVLIFDGIHFAQLVEGTHDAIEQLRRNLERDKRHAEMRVLSDGPAVSRCFNQFRMGYASIEEPQSIGALLNQDVNTVVTEFCALAVASDIEA